MKRTICVMLAFGLLAPSVNVASLNLAFRAQAAQGSATEGRIVEGDWAGPVGDGSIAFRFQYKDGSWLGWFVSGKDGKLYPLEDVQVSDRAVAFKFNSKPEQNFSLFVGKDDQTLAGTAIRPNGMATSYLLTRK